jgi:hypothetical protein
MTEARTTRVTPRWVVGVREILVAAAIALTGVSLIALVARRAADRDLDRLLAETGIERRQPSVALAARNDPDSRRARLAVARALLAEAFDPEPFGRLPQREGIEEASRAAERLEVARDLALRAWRERPAAWQAPMIAGGATYRLWSMRGDPRVVRERRSWEDPIRAAARLAPGEEEPPRLLAWARLEVWPALGEAERRETRDWLRVAFGDARTFELLAPLWLAVAGGRTEAFALVPARPDAWALVSRIYAGERRWEAYCASEERRMEVLRHDLDERLDEAAARIAGGDLAGARQLALAVLAMAPRDRLFAPAASRALDSLPAGVISADRGGEHWLRWAMDGAAYGRERLKPAHVARLLNISANLTPPEKALAHVAAGELASAEQVERRAEDVNLEAWAPYFAAKALLLASRGDAQGARAASARLHRTWRGSPAELDIRRAIAETGASASDLASARSALAALGRTRNATDWRWRGAVARLDIVTHGAPKGVEIGLDVVPADGAVVRVSLDGGTVLVAPVAAGATVVVPPPREPGRHLVEFATEQGGRVMPGAVTVVD